MRKDSQLKLNNDTGGGEESEGEVKLSNLPKSFGDDCSWCETLQKSERRNYSQSGLKKTRNYTWLPGLVFSFFFSFHPEKRRNNILP